VDTLPPAWLPDATTAWVGEDHCRHRGRGRHARQRPTPWWPRPARARSPPSLGWTTRTEL